MSRRGNGPAVVAAPASPGARISGAPVRRRDPSAPPSASVNPASVPTGEETCILLCA